VCEVSVESVGRNDQNIALVLHLRPVRMIGHWRLHLGQAGPVRPARELGIQSDEVLLICRHLGRRIDRAHWTLWHADRAIDAFIRIDHQEIRAGVEAVHGADSDAVGVFALDAGFGNDVRHCGARVWNPIENRSKLCCIKLAQVKISPAPAWAMEPPADVIYLERMRHLVDLFAGAEPDGAEIEVFAGEGAGARGAGVCVFPDADPQLDFAAACAQA